MFMRKIYIVLLMAISCCTTAMAQESEKVEQILSSMNLRRKVAQLFVPAVDPHIGDKARRELQISYAREGVGGMIVMDGNLVPFMQTLNELQTYARIPMLIAIDGEWGVSMRFPEFPYYPRQMQLGALKTPELVYRMGRLVGQEMKACHIGVNYAPDIDVNCNALNPVINTRSFGENQDKVGQFGLAYAKGMQDEGVSACAKHFPGHGDTSVDSHRALPVLEFTRERLDSLELAPFRILSEGGVDMVMLAHLSVPALDPSGTPTSVSKPAIDYLRDSIGYKGLIVTDALGMAGVMGYFHNNGPQTCLAAYKAGVDVLLMPKDVHKCIDLIVSKIRCGELSESDLDNRVRKVLAQKERQGLLADDYVKSVDVDEVLSYSANQQERDFIAELSAKTIVCVKDAAEPALSGKVAYLALGAGEEKRVHTMDEDPNRPVGGDGPAAYGARRGVGKSGAETLAGILGCDSFFLPRPFTFEQVIEMRDKLAGYDHVIIGFHDTDTRPQNHYGIDDDLYAFVGDWAQEQSLTGVYCGSPYALDLMPWYRHFRAFYIAWADNVYNCSAAGEIIIGKRKAEGVMPVTAGGLSAGNSGNLR